MLTNDELLDIWIQKVASGEPLASVRFGDTSCAIMAHEKILTMEFMKTQYPWVDDPKYITLPNASAREKLVSCLHEADLVGHLVEPSWGFKPLFDMVASFYKPKLEQTFYAFANAHLSRDRRFYNAFKDTKVLLCGAKAVKYQKVLQDRYGWTGIVGAVDCPTWDHHEEAMHHMSLMYSSQPYRLALVCAGVPGKMLTIHAKKLGAVGVDFGSGAEVAIQANDQGFDAWDYTGTLEY